MSTSRHSGPPYIRTVTAVAGGPVEAAPPSPTLHVQVYNRGAAAVNMWFDRADQAAGENSILLAASGNVGDYWEGPAEFSPYPTTGNSLGEKTRGPIIFQSTGADSNVTIVFYQRL